MNKYDLAAKVTMYIAVVSSVFLVGHFGLNVSFDKGKK
jgi:hypothetical protein